MASNAGAAQNKSKSVPRKPVAGDGFSDMSDPFASEDERPSTTSRPSGAASGRPSDKTGQGGGGGEEEEEPEPEKSIPKDLLTRILHEFFAKDATRISRDANATVGKYVDVFVREAIARAAVEKRTGFFEVEELEKVAPQLLLDL